MENAKLSVIFAILGMQLREIAWLAMEVIKLAMAVVLLTMVEQVKPVPIEALKSTGNAKPWATYAALGMKLRRIVRVVMEAINSIMVTVLWIMARGTQLKIVHLEQSRSTASAKQWATFVKPGV